MHTFSIPRASPGPPRPVVPQRIPTARPPIRVIVRAIADAQHQGASGLTPLFATLPENPPVSLIIATLPKSSSRNSFVCHTYETPRGPIPFRRSQRSSPISPLVTRRYLVTPLECAVTSKHRVLPGFGRNCPPVTPLECAVTQINAVTPLECALTKKVGGRGMSFRFSNLDFRGSTFARGRGVRTLPSFPASRRSRGRGFLHFSELSAVNCRLSASLESCTETLPSSTSHQSRITSHRSCGIPQLLRSLS